MKPVAQRTQLIHLVRALCGLVALRIAAPVLAAEKVVIGTPSRGLFEFPAVVAIRKGFYQEEGFTVDRVQMQPSVAVKALMSGDVDYLLAWGSAVRAAITGVPIKAVKIIVTGESPTRLAALRAGSIEAPRSTSPSQ